MKNILFTFFGLIYLFYPIRAQDYINQKYDRQRILMPRFGGACGNLDTSNKFNINGVLFDFRDDTLKFFPIDTFQSFDSIIPYYSLNENAQICNKQGEITAYFNGGELWDRNENKTIIDVFKYASATQYFHPAYNFNSSLILPVPEPSNGYLLLGPDDYHYDTRYGVEAGEQLSGVYFTESPDGILTISRQDSNFHKSKYTYNGAITACRHANGRDWWVVAPRRWGKYFSTFLLSPQGISYLHDSPVSDTIYDNAINPVFSPDGRWYTRTSILIHYDMYKKKNGVQIFPFDRCNGTFSDPLEIILPIEDTTGIGIAIFDHTSRYLYIPTCASVYQFDMWATDIAASRVKVCGYDMSLPDSNWFLCLGTGFLAPDGKIYLVDGNNNFRMSVINNPSAPGLACDARYAAVTKPSCTGVNPGNMPDFNLGPLDGSSCDTLGLDAVAIRKSAPTATALTISPNPNTGDCSVWLPSQGGTLQVFDSRGRLIQTFLTKNFQMEQQLRLDAGVYAVTFRSADGRIYAAGKIVVLR